MTRRKSKKPPKPKHKRVKQPKKPKKTHPVHARHRAFSLGKSTPASCGEPSALHAPATGGMAAHEIEPSATAGGGMGLSAVILNLVGEGVASLASGLVAWQREQDRITNRAWRRPGGMTRMGGL